MTSPSERAVRDAVAAKVIELVPEIVELKFGCYVMMKKYKGEEYELLNASISEPVPIVSMFDGVGGVERILYIDNFGNQCTDGLKKIDEDAYTIGKSRITEILGRPITLEDVLRAIDHKRFIEVAEMRMVSDDLAVTCEGQFVNAERAVFFDGKWHLSKPLSDQPIETITFLAQVLGVEESK